MKRSGWVLLLALASSTARAELVEKVAAVVNKDIIALSEVRQRAAPELARLSREADSASKSKQQNEIMRKTLDALIGDKLIEQQIKELNLDVTEPEVDAGIDDVRKNNHLDAAQFEQLLVSEGYNMSSYRDFMRKHLAKLKLVNLKVRSRVKISDEDLKAEYARFSKAEADEYEVHARHILLQTPANASPAEIEKARQQAEQLSAKARGGADFVELAKSQSQGPSAGEGGDLGFFKRGVMVPEFEKVAFALKPGEVSEPVRSKFGWHVIKVEERRALSVKPFEEVKEQLKDRILRGQLEKYTEQYVQELRNSAVVEVKL
jgi:peptidyl-prolyl cis-trans isomerase SurA